MPNDEPKISPSAMKAAVALVAEQVKVAQGERDYIGYEEHAQIIDAATHLTEKEAALRELVEVVKAVDKNSDCPDIDVHNARCIRRASALAKAKKVMEL